MTIQSTLDRSCVLAVDDHPVNRAFLRAVLRPHVKVLRLADSGLTAIECCEQRRFDLIVLDLHMPDLDGFSTWARIRELHPSPLPAVVALSADHREVAQQLARDAGFRGYIGKPATPEVLLASLHRIVQGEAVFEATGTSNRSAPSLLDNDGGLRALGTQSRLSEMRRAFAEELRTGLVDLEHAVLQDDPAALERLHQWVGAAGYVGAQGLAASAAQLREILQRHRPDQLGPAYLTFRRGAEATLDALDRIDS